MTIMFSKGVYKNSIVKSSCTDSSSLNTSHEPFQLFKDQSAELFRLREIVHDED